MWFKAAVVGICLFIMDTANSNEAYLKKFLFYNKYYENLPITQPTAEFQNFISSPGYLANKLRNRYLYQLVRQQDWLRFAKFYKKTSDINLQCYYYSAIYKNGYQTQALTGAKKLWLTPSSRPKSCDAIFEKLLLSPMFSNTLLEKRISLALNANNLSLAKYLLRLLKLPKVVTSIQRIQNNPSNITSIVDFGEFRQELYLLALKKLVNVDTSQALTTWRNLKKITPKTSQSFISYLALYKTLRGEPDAQQWFEKSTDKNAMLINWQIRLAIKQQNWWRVRKLIEKYQLQADSWQYWLARADAKTGKVAKSQQIYKKIAKHRSYYGFLASTKLKKPFSFSKKNSPKSLANLNIYKPLLDFIKLLVQNGQSLQAERIIHDFYKELPAGEALAFSVWVAQDLKQPKRLISIIQMLYFGDVTLSIRSRQNIS